MCVKQKGNKQKICKTSDAQYLSYSVFCFLQLYGQLVLTFCMEMSSDLFFFFFFFFFLHSLTFYWIKKTTWCENLCQFSLEKWQINWYKQQCSTISLSLDALSQLSGPYPKKDNVYPFYFRYNLLYQNFPLCYSFFYVLDIKGGRWFLPYFFSICAWVVVKLSDFSFYVYRHFHKPIVVQKPYLKAWKSFWFYFINLQKFCW